jgi:uncharacterized membrane protein
VERLKSHGKFIALHVRYEKKVLALTGCTYVWVNKMQMNSESWGMNHLHSAVLIVLASLLIACMYLNKDKTSSWKLKDINSNEQRSWCNYPLTPCDVRIFLLSLFTRYVLFIHIPDIWSLLILVEWIGPCELSLVSFNLQEKIGEILWLAWVNVLSCLYLVMADFGFLQRVSSDVTKGPWDIFIVFKGQQPHRDFGRDL